MAPDMKQLVHRANDSEHHMPPRQKLTSHRRAARTDKRQELSTARPRRTITRPTKVTTEHWRRVMRPNVVRDLVSATGSLRWSTTLIEVLLEELYEDYDIEKLLASAPRQLQHQQFPQAVALAVILRHSWRADDLASILERLGLSDAVPPEKS
jgi:hypothetical protein